MSSRLILRIAIATALLAGIGLAQVPTRSAQPLAELNLLGFDAAGPKTVVLPKPNAGNWWAGTWRLVSYPQGALVARGQFPQPKAWSGMGSDQYMLVELPDTLKAGTYILLDSSTSNGTRLSEPFTVRNGAYRDLVKASIKAFYYQRSSMELTEQYAGVWKRAAGHPGLQVTVFNDPQGRKWDSPRGWYDAGDYGLYVVNAGISTWSLMHIAEILPKYVDTLKWNIPPTDGGMPANLPDLLNEIKWETDWLLSMQDVDGGVWNKLTTWKHAASVMPSEDRGERFNLPKSTDATLNFVAVLAQAARVFKPYSAAYASKCSTAAVKGWEWTKRNPGVLFPHKLCRTGTTCADTGIAVLGTGWYDVSSTGELVQPRTWAATEMSLLTGKPADYFTAQERATWESSMSRYGIPSWQQMGMLGEFQMMTQGDLFIKAGMTLVNTSKNAVKAAADAAKTMIASNGYGVPLDSRSFYWGSNNGVANKGMALLYTFRATDDSSYLRAAQHTLDYLLGRNPVRKSFVTGFPPVTAENPVQRYPMHPHHRPSEKDGVVEPVPGMISGGPNSTPVSDQKCPVEYTNAAKPALSWIDHYCSYASNEIAINWNAPLFNLAAQLDAIYAEKAARQSGTSSTAARPTLLPHARIIGSRLALPAGGAARIALHDPAGRQLATFTVPASAAAREVMLPARPGLSVIVVQNAHGSQVLRMASTR